MDHNNKTYTYDNKVFDYEDDGEMEDGGEEGEEEEDEEAGAHIRGSAVLKQQLGIDYKRS